MGKQQVWFGASFRGRARDLEAAQVEKQSGLLRTRSQLQGSRGVGKVLKSMCVRDREGGAIGTSTGSFHQHI